MKKTEIEFQDSEHINKYLTHWTKGGFDILRTIIETKELKLSWNSTSFLDNKTKVSNMMICFTDTPIIFSEQHCKKYGYFGISFDKESLVNYGANPVLYLTEIRKPHYAFFIELSNRIPPHLINEDQKTLFGWFNSIMQPFSNNLNDKSYFHEYFEREWRISGRVAMPSAMERVLKEAGITWNEIPLEGKVVRKATGKHKPYDEDFFLSYSPSIIKNIIVPKDYSSRAEQLLKDNNIDCELILIKSV